MDQRKELGNLQLQADSFLVQGGKVDVPTRNRKKQSYKTSPKEHNFSITKSKDSKIGKISDEECKGLLVKMMNYLLITCINC